MIVSGILYSSKICRSFCNEFFSELDNFAPPRVFISISTKRRKPATGHMEVGILIRRIQLPLRGKCPNTEFISGPYFPAFGLDTERYFVSRHILSECGKIRTRINSVCEQYSHSVRFTNKKYIFRSWITNFADTFLIMFKII